MAKYLELVNINCKSCSIILLVIVSIKCNANEEISLEWVMYFRNLLSNSNS